MVLYLVLSKGRRPFKAGTTRKYSNYWQRKHEGGWQEVPMEQVESEKLESKITEPGRPYKSQSHPPKRMMELTPKQKKKLHAQGAASGRLPPKKSGYRKGRGKKK